MKFTRTSWIGETRYSSQITGDYILHEEHIVMIQAFDGSGDRLPYFKAAYIDEEGNVKLKLGFKKTVPAEVTAKAQPGVATEQFELTSTWELPGTEGNIAGNLDEAYQSDAKGKLRAWTNRSSRLFQTWNYVGFWGCPVGNVFNGNKPLGSTTTPLFVNGQGHTGDGLLIRTMCYSKDPAGKDPQFLKSSVLTRNSVDISNAGFEKFV